MAWEGEKAERRSCVFSLLELPCFTASSGTLALLMPVYKDEPAVHVT